MPSPFSQRYQRPLRNGVLSVDLSPHVRDKLLRAIGKHNHAIGVQRNPDDRWIDHSDVGTELALDLQEAGLWKSPEAGGMSPPATGKYITDLLTNAPGETVLDAVEMMWAGLFADRRELFVGNVNALLETEESCWRMVSGACIRLDPDFVGAGAAESALRALTSGPFAGAEDEYAKAMREQASGEVKDAMSDAAKSFESILKLLTGLEHANADRLLKELSSQGYLDDLPDNVREGFRGAVLMSLAFMRNKLAGHGQGADVVDVPPLYGVLALQMAGALNNFLITKYLDRHPPAAQDAPFLPAPDDDGFPF